MGRGVLPQILNCHVLCKEETVKIMIIRERDTQKGGDQKQQKKAEIQSKKKGNPGEVRREGSYKNLRKPELLTRGLQATHELGGLNVEV